MTPNSESSTGVLFVAIDVAKQIREVLIEPSTGDRQAVAHGELSAGLRPAATAPPGFSDTSPHQKGSHRHLLPAVRLLLHQCGFELRQISSLAVARTSDHDSARRGSILNATDKCPKLIDTFRFHTLARRS